MRTLNIDGITYEIKHIINAENNEEANKFKKLRNCDKVIIDKQNNKYLLCNIIKEVEFTEILND